VALLFSLAMLWPPSQADTGAGDELDRKELARFFFSIAATLNSDKSSVQILQTGMRVRNVSAESVRAAVRARYGEYDRTVEKFMSSVSELLDDPDSTPLLFMVLMDGHRACWHLASYTRLVETYGVSSSRLLSILSSTEACQRFTKEAFRPAVYEAILTALQRTAEREADFRALTEEVEELEKLLEDLRRIEAGE
jgi:hypothetical protein